MDFSQLSDDQLLQLIQASMAEAVSRGVAMNRAAQDFYRDSAEELRVKIETQARVDAAAEKLRLKQIQDQIEYKAETAEREAAKTSAQKSWAAKAAALTALKEYPLFAMDKDFQLNIWSRGTDRRVYLQEPGKNGWEIVYYETGNKYQPPGSLTGVESSEDIDRLRCFCQMFCDSWSSTVNSALSEVRHISPDPNKLAKYKKALNNV